MYKLYKTYRENDKSCELLVDMIYSHLPTKLYDWKHRKGKTLSACCLGSKLLELLTPSYRRSWINLWHLCLCLWLILALPEALLESQQALVDVNALLPLLGGRRACRAGWVGQVRQVGSKVTIVKVRSGKVNQLQGSSNSWNIVEIFSSGMFLILNLHRSS